MAQTIQVLKCMALASAACLCLSLACLSLGLQSAGAGLNASLAALNDPKAGTIHLLNEDLVRSRDLITHIDQSAFAAREASQAEVAYLGTWNASVTAAMANVNALLEGAKGDADALNVSQRAIAAQSVATLQTAQASIRGLQPAEDQATADLAQLEIAERDFDRLATNGDLTASLANLNETTKGLSGMVDDTAAYWHRILHPSWPRRIWNGVTGVGIDAARVFF